MTRDLDLIRQLLLDLEAFEQRPGGISHLTGQNFDIEGYNADQINYHLDLINEAGFVEGGGARPMVGIGFRRLTWAGHDFVDATRDKSVWTKTKETASRGGGFTVDLLVGIAKEIIKQNLGKLAGGFISS